MLDGTVAWPWCRPFLEDPLAVQGKLCRRIERHIKELFVFVSHPETPPDNNAAERSLRHLVISRKISGGTRSELGSDSKMTLASLFGTWRATGPQSPPGMPQAADFPSTLNSYRLHVSVALVSWARPSSPAGTRVSKTATNTASTAI